MSEPPVPDPKSTRSLSAPSDVDHNEADATPECREHTDVIAQPDAGTDTPGIVNDVPAAGFDVANVGAAPDVAA